MSAGYGEGTTPLRVPLNPFDLRDRRIQCTRDIPYVEGAGKRQQLDVYRLATGVEDAPVLLQIHGGAWLIGEKQHQGLPLMHELARRGWVCVAINYRLSPRHAWPAHLVDCKQALAWIGERIRDFGGDPGFVAVSGGSAGGHLTSLMGLTANDPALQPGTEAVDFRHAPLAKKLLLQLPQPVVREAEACFQVALQIARQQERSQ